MQIYKTVPKTGFLVRAGMRLLKRMEKQGEITNLSTQFFLMKIISTLKLARGSNTYYYRMQLHSQQKFVGLQFLNHGRNGRNTQQ